MAHHEVFNPDSVESTDLLVTPESILSSDREVAVFQLVEAGLAEVERRYGPNGLRPLPYHNADHSRDVVDAAIQLADAAIERGRIRTEDKDLLVLAACYHDIEKDFGSGVDEATSARVICLQMRHSQLFSDEEMVKVYKMIMATEVRMIDDIMHQSAPAEDTLSQLLADADLATLGKTPHIYWDRALRYAKEVTGSAEPTCDELVAFALSQDAFLRNHTFYTPEATTIFHYKESNLRFTQQIQRYYASHPLALGGA